MGDLFHPKRALAYVWRDGGHGKERDQTPEGGHWQYLDRAPSWGRSSGPRPSHLPTPTPPPVRVSRYRYNRRKN